ncbi:hypothetical protein [Deinococcus cellulosilyticus]|uniref:Uncharacterized protein n=1 Tax=Deinococcus cellulosilyticus (strain DSM 18568 / NBRC 106333 / KACC 11606 / 5516J-15) TaxID=1223518 RepID=A0A511N7J4_DEIC1|nr:hypothetical protein [Deinococcus cellulosilyticus]GEM48813.1 hypothetical protein DC3_44480 [Deinococcus cellulosilyticus NBRC 106333 = KACC 11606]
MSTFRFEEVTITLGGEQIQVMEIHYHSTPGDRPVWKGKRGVWQASGEIRVNAIGESLALVLSRQEPCQVPQSRVEMVRKAKFIRRGNRARKLQVSRARKWGWR